MIKHIVLWRLKDHAMGASKNENAKKLKALLESLRDNLREIKHLEVGINVYVQEAPLHAAVAHGIVNPSLRSPAPCRDAQVSPEAGGRKRPTLAEPFASALPCAAVAHGIVPPATLADPCAADVALYSEFSTWDDLEAYQKHPEHLKVVSFVQEIRLERHVVDYEIPDIVTA